MFSYNLIVYTYRFGTYVCIYVWMYVNKSFTMLGIYRIFMVALKVFFFFVFSAFSVFTFFAPDVKVILLNSSLTSKVYCNRYEKLIQRVTGRLVNGIRLMYMCVYVYATRAYKQICKHILFVSDCYCSDYCKPYWCMRCGRRITVYTKTGNT